MRQATNCQNLTINIKKPSEYGGESSAMFNKTKN